MEPPNSWTAQSHENGGFNEQHTIFKPREVGLQVPCSEYTEMPSKNTLWATSEEFSGEVFHELARQKESMRILHVNVRLLEGGAARIALDLHRQLLSADVESRFAYGWGEKGGKSSMEDSVPNSFQVGQQLQVASNMLSHRVVGIDYLPLLGEGRKKMVGAIRWADVVHLHVIHSYFLPLGWLVGELISAAKPVVWTAHDYWMLTGRCAFTEGCEGWRNGCGSCPTQENYPQSYLDFSASQFKIKRRLLAQLGSQLSIVTPSEFVAKAIREGLPNLIVNVVSNWIDSEFEAALSDVPLTDTPMKISTKKIKVIVIANDLSDPSKVNRDVIFKMLEMSHIEVHTIGQNSPFIERGVFNHGKISDRQLMVETIASSDVALFTSEKDTFGLVMIEALACGVPVFAIDSLAAREVLSALDILPINSMKEIVNLLQNGELPSCYFGMSGTMLRENVLKRYGRNVAVAQYKDVYSGAVRWKK